MNRNALLATVLLVSCLACSREEAPAPTPEPHPGTATAPTAATAPVASVASAPATAPVAEDPAAAFDRGAFAGTFVAGGTRLELHADGTYGLEAPEGVSQGTWTHEAASQSVRLDPGSKTAADRVFRLTDRDTLATLDAAGRPAGSPLRRQPAS